MRVRSYWLRSRSHDWRARRSPRRRRGRFQSSGRHLRQSCCCPRSAGHASVRSQSSRSSMLPWNYQHREGRDQGPRAGLISVSREHDGVELGRVESAEIEFEDIGGVDEGIYTGAIYDATEGGGRLAATGGGAVGRGRVDAARVDVESGVVSTPESMSFSVYGVAAMIGMADCCPPRG